MQCVRVLSCSVIRRVDHQILNIFPLQNRHNLFLPNADLEETKDRICFFQMLIWEEFVPKCVDRICFFQMLIWEQGLYGVGAFGFLRIFEKMS